MRASPHTKLCNKKEKKMSTQGLKFKTNDANLQKRIVDANRAAIELTAKAMADYSAGKYTACSLVYAQLTDHLQRYATLIDTWRKESKVSQQEALFAVTVLMDYIRQINRVQQELDAVLRIGTNEQFSDIIRAIDAIDPTRGILNAYGIRADNTASNAFQSQAGAVPRELLDLFEIIPRAEFRNIIIVGQTEAKREIENVLKMSSIEPSVIRSASGGLTRRPFVVLTGPPGTGKTSMAKYAADKLSKDLAIIETSALLGTYVGELEKRVNLLFEHLPRLLARYVVLFDEADGLLAPRTSNEARHEKRQVTSFLTGMEKLKLGSASRTGFMFFTSNSPLDMAVVRRSTMIKIDKPITIDEYAQLIRRLCTKWKINVCAPHGIVQGALSKHNLSDKNLKECTFRPSQSNVTGIFESQILTAYLVCTRPEKYGRLKGSEIQTKIESGVDVYQKDEINGLVQLERNADYYIPLTNEMESPFTITEIIDEPTANSIILFPFIDNNLFEGLEKAIATMKDLSDDQSKERGPVKRTKK